MIIPADFAQANFRFTGVALPNGAELTLGLDIALYPGTPAALATGLGADFVSSGFLPLMSSEVSMSSVLVKFGPNATGPSAVSPVAGGGTGASTSVTPNVTTLIRKNTAFGGRSGRGRWYFPGCNEANVANNGDVSGAYITAMNTALITFLGKIETRDVTPVLLHGVDAPLTIPTPITSMQCQPLAATQRRRLRR